MYGLIPLYHSQVVHKIIQTYDEQCRCSAEDTDHRTRLRDGNRGLDFSGHRRYVVTPLDDRQLLYSAACIVFWSVFRLSKMVLET